MLRKRTQNKKLKGAVITIIFLSLWTLLVLYPNPYRLFASLYRIYQPAVNANAIAHLQGDLPETAQEIEEYVLRTVPYQYDWQTYGVPFYFPRVDEVLEKGAGDCKSRFVVLASIFESLEIPYQQQFSLSHFWINYEGKEENPIEIPDSALFVRNEQGLRIQLPKDDLMDIFEVLKEGFWTYMPFYRKILLLSGLPLSLLLGFSYTLFSVKNKPLFYKSKDGAVI